MHVAFHDQDPEVIGYGNDITPLAVVAAARWRKTLADVQREETTRKAEADRLAAEQEKELKSRTEGACYQGQDMTVSCIMRVSGSSCRSPVQAWLG